MDEWSNLCRCCLTPDSQVSLTNAELNVKEKFLEVTTIEVNEEDGLPQKLCKDCFTVLNSAYQFRKQCLKMEQELRLQLEAAILRQTQQINTDDQMEGIQENQKTEVDSNNTTDDPMKQLESIVKMEAADSDEDFYLFLVINDKDKDKSTGEPINEEHPPIKIEPLDNVKVSGSNTSQVKINDDFENSIGSFLMSDKVPANVPATILENEEDSQGNDNFEIILASPHDANREDSQSEFPENSIAQVESMDEDENVAEKVTENLAADGKNRYIKIITSSGQDGTLLLKGNDKVAYLADTELETNDNGDDMSQDEVIFYEGDDPSQLELLKCEGSELIIEYADEGQIATVLQQEDGTFLCHCGVQCADLTEYEKHQYTHSQSVEYLCNLCGKGFESDEILTGHTLLHKVTGLLIMCPFCDQLIKRNSLTQHIKYGHNNIRPRCKLCLKTFANPNNLKRHMLIHNNIKKYECDICFKKFNQKITMQTHRITHMNPFICAECGMTFEDKESVNAHKESNECTKSRIGELTQEMIKKIKQEITTSSGKLFGYACSLCNKMFSVESVLDKHIETSHVLNPSELLCSECGEVLPSKKEMQTHIGTHRNVKSRNVKRFECSICSKGCASQAMLIMHERVHTNERPFPCALCSLRFKTKTHLRTHQLTHTREKKFGCSVCLKFFALKGNLVVHLRTHTGERPYVCSLCGEAFIDSKYLKKHKLKKHAIDNVPWNKY